MLQATIKDKARNFFLKNGQRVPREDILTDCLFGGLRYLPPEKATIFLRWALGEVISSQHVVSEIKLWPKEECREPDAKVVLQSRNIEPITIIVEAKWGANRLTAAQLDDQWRIFGVPASGSVFHLLLLEHRKRIAYLALEGAPLEIRRQRILVTWADIAARLVHRNLALGTTETNNLASDIAAVLQHSGQKLFKGWSKKEQVAPLEPGPLFHSAQPWWQLPERVVKASTPMFFQK
jgi:hypothetical protein